MQQGVRTKLADLLAKFATIVVPTSMSYDPYIDQLLNSVVNLSSLYTKSRVRDTTFHVFGIDKSVYEKPITEEDINAIIAELERFKEIAIPYVVKEDDDD